MEIHLLYWHWLVLGMVLILAEIFIPSFTIFWFGLAALVVGLLAFLGVDPSLEWQLFLWILLSVAFTLAWFKWIKPKATDKTKAGISREAVLGERGMVIKAPSESGERGEVRFTVPLLGAETWPCLSQAQLHAGDPVIVKDVLGNALLVDPVSPARSDSQS